MDPISSGDSDFGRDEELVVDNHLRSPERKSIYKKALETSNSKERKSTQPIVWPSGAKTLNFNNNNSGNILFGDSFKMNSSQKNNNINFNAVDFLL